MPRDIGVIDLMLSVPDADTSRGYEFLQPQLKDRESGGLKMPAGGASRARFRPPGAPSTRGRGPPWSTRSPDSLLESGASNTAPGPAPVVLAGAADGDRSAKKSVAIRIRECVC